MSLSCDSKRKAAVIIGGGVAGTSCAIHLNALSPTTNITLIDPKPSLKLCHALTHLSHSTLDTTICEEEAQKWCDAHNITFLKAHAVKLTASDVILDNGNRVSFNSCCIASGARPFLPPALKDSRFSDCVLTLRDTDSVHRLRERLGKARRIIVVGAGGIGMEVVHEIVDCEVIWVVKGTHIGGLFFDEQVADFVHRRHTLPSEKNRTSTRDIFERHEANQDEKGSLNPNIASPAAAAVGPNWLGSKEKAILLDKQGKATESHMESLDRQLHGASGVTSSVRTVTRCEVISLHADKSAQWRMIAELSDGGTIGCDIVIVGTGVVPNTEWMRGSGAHLEEDGGLRVFPDEMHTTLESVFAAGDCTHVVENPTTDWVQMRTWGQALAGGRSAAANMACHMGLSEVGSGLEFEVFAHSTRFFGLRVVLLGRWKAQGLSDGFKILERFNNEQFIRVVLYKGRVRGTVLIGDVDNAEIFENLIVGQMDVSWMEDALVDENVELENYFD